MTPTMLKVKDVAERLGLSYESALSFVKYSGIDFLQIGRQYLVAEEKLTAFLMKKGQTYVDLNLPYR